jgi:hypothetical protein
MRDFRGILQVFVVVTLVTIAGLLFSINRKLDSQNHNPPPPVAATVASPAPAPEIAATQPSSLSADPIKAAPMEAPPPVHRVEKPKPSKMPDSPVNERADRLSDVPNRTPPPDAPPAPVPAPLPAKDPNGIAYTNDGTTPPITAALPPMPMAPPPPPPPPPKTIMIPEGTSFRVRLLDSIDAAKNHAGDTFRATLDENMIVDGAVIANRGSSVVGRLVEDKQSGRVSGVASITLTVERLTTIGGEQTVSSDVVKKDAPSSKGKDAATVGTLTALGAIIGAVAGHGKGAAIGAGAGAGAGAIDVLTTKGKDLKLGRETLLIFRLNTPVSFTVDPSRVQARNGNNSDEPTTDPADRPYLRRRNPE